jgi:hypothetical protein
MTSSPAGCHGLGVVMGRVMALVVRELTADLWPALEDLFAATGPVGRCWYRYWRVGAEDRARSPQANKRAFRKVVADGPRPGLLAFDGDTAVGWCQPTSVTRFGHSTARGAFDASTTHRSGRSPASTSARAPQTRRYGVLIAAALEMGYRRGAVATEAYPFDAKPTPRTSHTGDASTSARAGFVTVVRHVPRPIVRCEFDQPGRPPERSISAAP